MSWRDEWPGVPRTDRDEDPDADRSGPFRVALKPSACDAAPTVDSLREDEGEIVRFDSRSAARRRLLEELDCDGVRFQRPAPNDPADVDAYLVAVHDEEPAPPERGPPADGWTFATSAQQVGALSEALFGAYRWDPPPIVAYAARDLELAADEFSVEIDRTPSSVGRADDGGGVWVPDLEFVVRRAAAGGRRADGAVLKRYLAEVKHGSTSFERAQRTRMERLAREAGPSLAVLVVRVDLEEIPRAYDLTIRPVDPERDASR